MSHGTEEHERIELEKTLAALGPESPARGPILAALRALDEQRASVRPQAAQDENVLESAPATSTSSRPAPVPAPQKQTVRNAVVAASLVLLVGVTAYMTQTAVVPSVVDEERSFAAGALRSAGFEIDVQTKVDGDVREGHVLEQNPAGGSRIRKGTAVSLVVAELPSFTLRGSFTLFAATDGPANNCQGRRGYDDIKGGVSVTVRDGASRILATGNLENGQRSAAGGSCSFVFRVPNIKQADFYSVEVGRRGSLSYSHTEMTANDWTVAFSLG
jgi:hypothetical protein